MSKPRNEPALETVDVIASGYEWICLTCNELNQIDAVPKTGIVICSYEECGAKFTLDLPEHCRE